MKLKSKLIASIMSVCLVCAVFAIGVFALKTANLKIGGDVSFTATGIKATVSSATVSNLKVLEGEPAANTLAGCQGFSFDTNTSRSALESSEAYLSWQNRNWSFDEFEGLAKDIVMVFTVTNDNTDTNEYVQVDITATASTVQNCEIQVDTDSMLLGPELGIDTDYSNEYSFRIVFHVLDRETSVDVKDFLINVNMTRKTVEDLPTVTSGSVYNDGIEGKSSYEYASYTLTQGTPNIASATLVADATVEQINLFPFVKDSSGNIYRTRGTSNGSPISVPKLKKIVLPNTFEWLGYSTLVYASSLESLSLPKSFKGSNGQTLNSTLRYIVNHSDNPIPTGGAKTSLIELRPQDQYMEFKNNGFTFVFTKINSLIVFECDSATGNLVIPNGATRIGGGVFSGCTGLTSVEIPDSVTSIGDSAFSGCTGLTSVEIPANVTSIGNYAFSDCGGLTMVTIPDSVTRIGHSAFKNCKKLNSISIPGSVTKIEMNTFEGCTELKSVTLGNGIVSIAGSVFYSCVGLNSITIPASVTSIGSSAFSGCVRLSSVEFKNTTGWMWADSSSATSGTALEISATNFASNATLLRTTYVYKYWFRTAE